MSKQPFIAELHDIGKLVDTNSADLKDIKKGHEYGDFDFKQYGYVKPTSPSWYQQISDGKSLKSQKIEPDYRGDVLLSKIADNIASTVSRTHIEDRHKKGEVVHRVHILWNPQTLPEAATEWAAFTTRENLSEMFHFIDTCRSHEEFFRRYEIPLRRTPEDKSRPCNVISLYRHLELQGKIYRVLRNHCRYDQENKKINFFNRKGKIDQGDNINNIAGGHLIDKNEKGEKILDYKQKGKWVARIVQCWVDFPHRLSRLRDLNILRKRMELIEAIASAPDTQDYVLYHTSDFLCLFLPLENVCALETLLAPLIQANFIIRYAEMESELMLLTSSFDQVYRRFHDFKEKEEKYNRQILVRDKSVYQGYREALEPPLCEICQAATGKPRAKDQVTDYICDHCQSLRDFQEPVHQLTDWEKMPGKVAWVKISLNQEDLEDVISKLYDQYVDSIPEEILQKEHRKAYKENLRPLALKMEFVQCYYHFLDEFESKIRKLVHTEDLVYPIENYNELLMLRLDRDNDLVKLCDLYLRLMDTYFPECIRNDLNPIVFSVDCADAKFPYMAHWEFLSHTDENIRLRIPGKLQLKTSVKLYQELRDTLQSLSQSGSRFLHQLENITQSGMGNSMVMLELMNQRRRHAEIFRLAEHIVQNQKTKAKSGVNVIQPILAFYKLVQHK